MDVVFDHPTIGDILLSEPALRRLAEASGEPVRYACFGPARELLEGHPAITLIEAQETAPGALRFDALEAWVWAMGHCRHFTDAYYAKLGLDPDAVPYMERKPRFYGAPFDALPVARKDFACIMPASANCTGVLKPGSEPNKTIAIDWWADLVARLPLPCVQLGASGDRPVPGAQPLLGRPLREAAAQLAGCRLAITVENGIGVVAGAVDAPILYLSAADPFWLVDPKSAAATDHLVSGVPPGWRVEEAEEAARRILGA